MSALDPYLIPGTLVLKNRVGLDSAELLAIAEADLVNARIVQLMDSGDGSIPASRDFSELSAIHFHLFQDIYDWAGSLRTIDFKKGNGEFFAPHAMLEANLGNMTVQLAESGYLRGRNRDSFLNGLTYFYEILNWIHPFREGNGRAQRHFWSRVAADAGWILDWRPVQNEIHEASRLAREDDDSTMLKDVLGNAVVRSG